MATDSFLMVNQPDDLVRDVVFGTDPRPGHTTFVDWDVNGNGELRRVKERDAIIARIEGLQDVVKLAREGANSIEVKQRTDMGALLDYIFTS